MNPQSTLAVGVEGKRSTSTVKPREPTTHWNLKRIQYLRRDLEAVGSDIVEELYVYILENHGAHMNNTCWLF